MLLSKLISELRTETHKTLLSNSGTRKLFLLPVLGSTLALSFNPVAAEEFTAVGELLFPEDSLISVEESTILLDRYGPITEKGSEVYLDQWQLDTQINYVKPDAPLQFHSLQQDVWVYMQYFTDIDGDGVYEWVFNYENTPTWDTVAKANTLLPTSQVANWHKMSENQTRVVTGNALFERGLEIEQDRSQWDILPYTESGGVIYCVTFSSEPLHLGMSATNSQTYYLKVIPDGHKDASLLGSYTFEDLHFLDEHFYEIDHCLKTGILTGDTSSLFSPELELSRATLLELLYRYSGEPLVYPRTFADIHKEEWYAIVFTWALDLGILGAENGKFRPEDPLTTEEFTGIIYNYVNGSKKPNSTTKKLTHFTDGNLVKTALVPAVIWATETGFLTADENNNLNPQSIVTKEDCAVIFATLEEYYS